MRTFRPWRTRPESYAKQRAAGRYNPATELQYFTDKSYTVTLEAGTSDELDVFNEGATIFVLSTNQGLGYVGMQAFEDGEQIGAVFIDGDDAAYFLNLTPVWRAKKLAEQVEL